MKKYIVCDACYIINDKEYQDKMIKLWFPDGFFVRDIQVYGDDKPNFTDTNGNPLWLIRSIATNGWDCVVDGLGCDAGNFSLFASETFSEDRPHMFRYFDSEDEAMAYLEKIIKQS